MAKYQIELSSCARHGNTAYIQRWADGDRCGDPIYGYPASEEDKSIAQRRRKHRVIVDIPSDGMFSVKEAGGITGKRTEWGWIKVDAGEVVESGEGYPPTTPKEGLPPLQGTFEQVTWAEAIRAKALKASTSLSTLKAGQSQSSAKWWIENGKHLK